MLAPGELSNCEPEADALSTSPDALDCASGGADESAGNVPDVDGSTVWRPMDVLPFSVVDEAIGGTLQPFSVALAFALPMAGAGSSTFEKHIMLHSTSTAAAAGPGEVVDGVALLVADAIVDSDVDVGDGDDGISLPAVPRRGSLCLRCCWPNWWGTGGAGSSGRSHCVDLVL